MSSLPAIHFPPPAQEIEEHGDTSIINAPLEPQPLPIPSTRWYFDKEQLISTPSRIAGIDADKELTYRQQSANFIQDMGQRLQVNQLCINTAIVYMHRFYMYHSFHQFQKNAISTASIFLAAKVEEQPRKLEYVIKIAHYCLYRDTQPAIDVKSEVYVAQSTELVSNENILLQTLGFDVSVDHPHTHVVKCCQLVRASKDLAQTSYFMATNSLHLTTMCLQYPPSVVACVCIHLACKWSNWEIPRSKEGREWYFYVDGSVTPQQLESLTAEFLTIFNKSPSRLKKKILSLSNATSGGSGGSGGNALTNFPTHFTVDRNSSGAQTIKSRSRTPSPTSSAAISRSMIRPPAISANSTIVRPIQVKPIKPVPSVIPPHHYGNKPVPGLPPPGHPQAKHALLTKPQFPHAPMQIQPHLGGSSKDGNKHPTKSGQFHIAHTPANGGSHQENRFLHVSQLPSLQSSHGQTQQGLGPSQRPPTIGSQTQSTSHPPLVAQNIACPRHSLLKPGVQPSASHTSASANPYVHNSSQNKEGMQNPSKSKTNSAHYHQSLANGTHSTPPNNQGMARPPSGISQSGNNATIQALNYLNCIPSTKGGLSEYLKRRPVESAGGDPTPKRSRHDGLNLHLHSLVPEEKPLAIPKYAAIKSEFPESTGFTSSLIEEKKVDIKSLLPKVESFESSLTPMSLSAFPLLSSEIGLSNSSSTSSASRYVGMNQLQTASSPSLPTSTDLPITTLPNFNISPKPSSKKKKKKERKHKKDKDKEHRHKDKQKGKEEKKHKKGKHREKDTEAHASKKKKGKPSELGISQAQDNSLKIKIVASKEAMDSKSLRGSGKNLQSNTVVYY